MAQTGVREIVLEILLSVTRDGQYGHIILKNVLDKYQYLDKKERAFITRVTNGTLERMIEIDYVIGCFSKTPVRRMKPVIREIIRSAVYQILYMDGAEDYAACSEAVKLAAKRGFGGLKGFVNGVLRNISRNKDRIPYPDRSDEVSYISVAYSLPEWLVREWLPVYGADTVMDMGRAFLETRPVSVRCNTARLTPEELLERFAEEGVRAEREPSLSYAFYLSGYDHLAGLRSFQDGCFYVQDVSSMQVAEWAEPGEGDYIIDVCAAPGGKALHLAEKLKGSGHVEARDLTDHKVGLIRENIERSGLSNITAVRRDAAEPDEDSVGKADIVIADLPCSGLGVLGRKPDLKYRMTPGQQEELVKLQRRILGTVCAYVKPGGKLIYSTCTINRAENEENAAWFAAGHPEFTLLREEQMLPGRPYGDGFYIALFRRES